MSVRCSLLFAFARFVRPALTVYAFELSLSFSLSLSLSIYIYTVRHIRNCRHGGDDDDDDDRTCVGRSERVTAELCINVGLQHR